MASRLNGIIRSHDDRINGKTITIHELIQKLLDGEIRRGRNGEYTWREHPNHPWGEILCPLCSSHHEGEGPASARFESIGRYGGETQNANLPEHERQYHSWFKHDSLETCRDISCPCEEDLEVGIPIRPIRYQPYIRVRDDENLFELITSVIRPESFDDATWDVLNQTLDDNRGGSVNQWGESSEFIWDNRPFGRITLDLGGSKYRIAPYQNHYKFWGNSEGRITPLPIQTNHFQVPISCDNILLPYSNCECENIAPGDFCNCQISGHDVVHFGPSVPSPMIFFKDIQNPNNHDDFTSLVDAIYPDITVRFGKQRFWEEWSDGFVRGGYHTSVDQDSIRFLFATRTSNDTNMRMEYSPFDWNDGQSGLFANWTEDERMEQDFNLGAYDPSKIEKMEIPLAGGTTQFWAFKVTGSGILNIKIRDSNISYRIRLDGDRTLEHLQGDDRNQVLRIGVNLDPTGGFQRVEDAYNSSFECKIWDFLRFTANHMNEQEGGPFTPNNSTRRLNKLRALMPELDSLGLNEDLEGEDAPESTASLFSRLMEWVRPMKDPDDEEGYIWNHLPSRVVGSENMDWCLLFDRRPVSELIAAGIDVDQLKLLNNGLRLIRPDAVEKLGIQLQNRLPAIDHIHPSSAQFLHSLFADREDEYNVDAYTALYERLQEQYPREFMFHHDHTRTDSDYLQINGSSMNRGLRQNQWWSEDTSGEIQYEMQGIQDPFSLRLHRFMSRDNMTDEWSHEFWLIRIQGDVKMAVKIFSKTIEKSLPIPWYNYICSAPKKERSIRKFSLLIECIRAFVSNSDKECGGSMDNLPISVSGALPYTIRTFFSGRFEKFSAVQAECPDLADFVSKNTYEQLWF